VKILVANLGSTSLKWRLFDFSNGGERLCHKGGFERVTDYPKAIGDCLQQLKEGGHIEGERDLAAVWIQNYYGAGSEWLRATCENVVKSDGSFQWNRACA